jgi:hypothetical protein
VPGCPSTSYFVLAEFLQSVGLLVYGEPELDLPQRKNPAGAGSSAQGWHASDL